MSAPIRVQVKADEVPTAEAVRPEQQTGQPTPADSDLTRETPRVMFSDLPGRSTSQNREQNPGTRQENEHASVKPLVVRTLKDPPEIWDLVHETPAHFNPTGNFVGRLTSRKTNRILLMMLGVMLISGLAAFAFMTLSDGRTIGGVAAQVRERFGNSQTALTSQASAPESALNAPVSAPVNASPSDPANAPGNALNAPVNASPGAAESVVDNTAPQPTAPPPTDPPPTASQSVPSPHNAAFADQATSESIQPTGVDVNNISKRTAPLPRRAAAWSRKKRVTVASSGWQNDDNPADKPADKRSPDRGASPAPRPVTSAKTLRSQAPQSPDLKERYEKNSNDPPSANKGSSRTLSPQLIAPPTTTSAPKGKVIQWP